MLAPVQSLAQLRSKARTDYGYQRLIVAVADSYGCEADDWETSFDLLQEYARNNDEDEVIEEVNFRRYDIR